MYLTPSSQYLLEINRIGNWHVPLWCHNIDMVLIFVLQCTRRCNKWHWLVRMIYGCKDGQLVEMEKNYKRWLFGLTGLRKNDNYVTMVVVNGRKLDLVGKGSVLNFGLIIEIISPIDTLPPPCRGSWNGGKLL